jgi:hypothetical protein
LHQKHRWHSGILHDWIMDITLSSWNWILILTEGKGRLLSFRQPFWRRSYGY